MGHLHWTTACQAQCASQHNIYTLLSPHWLLHAAGKDQIERLLALGASRGEATADLVGRSVKLAMTPSLNTMSVVGLVSIPGNPVLPSTSLLPAQ